MRAACDCFTGKERDAESGNDYFGARYYASTMGRFLSPDDGSDQNGLNPQSWNLYSYGRNNPLIGIDDDGRSYRVCDANGQNCSTMDDNTFESDQSKDQKNGEYFQNGTMFHKDADGNNVTDGTYKQTDVDMPGNAGANIAAMGQIGRNGTGAVNWFMTNMALDLAGGAVGYGLEAGADALQAWRAANFAKVAEAAADAEKITNGHAFLKHAGEFGGIGKNEFKQLVQETISNPSDARSLANGRTAFWNESEQMVVIKNPNAADGGTAFRPTAGKAYFDNLR